MQTELLLLSLESFHTGLFGNFVTTSEAGMCSLIYHRSDSNFHFSVLFFSFPASLSVTFTAALAGFGKQSKDNEEETTDNFHSKTISIVSEIKFF